MKKKIYITNCFLHPFIYKRNVTDTKLYSIDPNAPSWEYSRNAINNTTSQLYISVPYSSKTPFHQGVKWVTRVFYEGFLTLTLKIEYEELIKNTSK